MLSQTKKKKSERPFHGFVTCDLDASTKESAKEWIKKQDGLDEIMERLLDGYKLSISQDLYNDCFQASLTSTDENSPNFGWCLVGRAPTYLSAVGMVAYKHLIILAGEWSDSQSVSKRDDWG